MSNRVVLQLDPSPRNSRNSESSFIAVASGRIYIAWSKYTSSNSRDDGAAVIATRYSDDEGRTWSSRDVVWIKQEGERNVMSPSLLRLQDGRVALLYLRKDGPDCIPNIRYSEDECKSWSAPQRIVPVSGYYVVNNDRLVQLKSRRIIVPIAYHRQRGPGVIPAEPIWGEPVARIANAPRATPGLIFFYISDDGGANWYESLGSYYHCSPDGNGLQEPGVVELEDGRLWSWARSGVLGPDGKGRQWQSYSEDKGWGWLQAEPSQFISPLSPMQVRRIPSTGDLLAIWNDRSGHFKTAVPKPCSWDRTPLVSAISDDEGITWKYHQLLEKSPDHGFCYPAVHFTEDAVLLAYSAGGASSKLVLDTLRVRRITLKELYK